MLADLRFCCIAARWTTERDRPDWVELTSSWVRGESLNPRTKQTNFTKGCTAGPGQFQPVR
jgi:hypothetical protein